MRKLNQFIKYPKMKVFFTCFVNQEVMNGGLQMNLLNPLICPIRNYQKGAHRK